jgi:hypothetical protein
MSPSNEIRINVGEGYAWILLEAVLITIHIWVTGMVMGKVRRKYFTKDFYEKNFPQYKQLVNVMKPDGGYPDDGQGRLAEKLTDEQWFTFNNYRRAHMNYLEVCFFFIFYFKENILFYLKGAFPVLIPLLISGLSYTRLAFIAGLIYIIGREIYSQGYRRSGSKGRLYGALMLDLALLILWASSLYTCWHWGNGFNGLTRLILAK